MRERPNMIEELNPSVQVNQDGKANRSVTRLQNLLAKLREKELPAPEISYINERIQALNAIQESEKTLINKVRKAQYQILSHLEKTTKLVAKNHYRNMWMPLGLASFGIPIGLVFGAALGNMGLFGLGMPIGLVVGLAVGTAMDKKAAEEGRQLDFEAG